MPTIALDIFIFLISFIILWVGSGLIISSVNKLSLSLKIPSFFVSFFILGILTSTPEIAVGLSAISSNTPSIFVGNLLGGAPVLFLMVVPVLAILGGGINLNHKLKEESILLALILSISPFFVLIDGEATTVEGISLVILYAVVAYILQRSSNLLNQKNIKMLQSNKYSFMDIAKVLLGTGIVLFSSNMIVSKTLFFSDIYNIAPFYISLLVLSIGTNLPELAIAIRAILSGNKDIALGDYLGSASANAMLFGGFTVMAQSQVVTPANFTIVFTLIAIGLVLFFLFARSKRFISPKEGLVLLTIYLIFVVLELTA